ncbi:MAG TPA: hypothetical protein VK927_05140, partial [Adhaeribacter sp.]|nr:hypothetical protein [Adhaeribacter sp.]
MSTDNKDFEDFFRERLEGLEEAPPANGWEKIRQDIKQPWYRKVNWLAAAALLCLLSVAFYFATRLPQPAEQPLARQTGKTVQPAAKTGLETDANTGAATNPAGTSSGASKEAAGNAQETAGAENLASGANQPQTTGTFSAQNPTVSEPQTKPETNLPLIALNRNPKAEKPATREPAEDQTGKTESTAVAAGSARAKTIAAAGLVAATGNRYARTAKKSVTETNATQPASAPEELVSSRTASPAQTSETTTAATVQETSGAPGASLNQEIALLALHGLNS